ncbi:MAG: hypothetical protein CSA58_08195 [Micrococcales bacterium]|nr:MAG: hypothetical protein CSB46_00765 [Micrococcales bacterium]PIE26689.1 MAG: hypothetical protein CSA58_08195 [Micrococcales bacterium]
MIDFKYHLVSLVSVFMALAIGIVLGAGPLQDQIGVTLNNQVEHLRAETDQLRAQSLADRSSLESRDQVLAELTATIVAGQLAGRQVVVVRLPDAPDEAVTGIEDALQRAGGTVSGQVDIDPAWAEPGQARKRADAVERIVAITGDRAPGAAEVNEYLDRQLAAAVTATSQRESATQSLHGPQVLKALESAGLLTVSGSPQQRATMMVAVDGNRAVERTPARAQLDERYLALLRQLCAKGRGGVLAAPERDEDTTNLLESLRRDDQAGSVISGVGDADTAVGPIAVVFALAEQGIGETGQYGSGADADAPFPPVPTTRPGPRDTP